MSVEKLQDYLRNKNYDGILLRKRNNFSWVTGGSHNFILRSEPEGVADIVVMQNKVWLVTSKMEERRMLEEECIDLPFDFDVLSDDWYNGTDAIISSLGKDKKMVSDTPYGVWQVVSDDLIEMRSCLSGEEIDRYRWLCQTAARAVETTCKEIQPGQTEHEIAAQLAGKVIAHGIQIQVLLVATDDRIYNYRHPIPTDKRVENYAMLVFGGERGGLVANVTRLVHFGPLPEDLKANKEKLARIDTVMNANTKPGTKSGDIIQAAIKEYEKAGFPEDWKKLHQGGLTGYESREYFATPDSEYVIQQNQAFTWNPSLPGIKSEDTILARRNRVELLTNTGEWEYIGVGYEGLSWNRPDILVKT